MVVALAVALLAAPRGCSWLRAPRPELPMSVYMIMSCEALRRLWGCSCVTPTASEPDAGHRESLPAASPAGAQQRP